MLIKNYYSQLSKRELLEKDEIIVGNKVETKYKNYCAEFVAYSRISGLNSAQVIFSSDSTSNDRKKMLKVLTELLKGNNALSNNIFTETNRMNIEAACVAISLYLRTFPEKEA